MLVSSSARDRTGNFCTKVIDSISLLGAKIVFLYT